MFTCVHVRHVSISVRFDLFMLWSGRVSVPISFKYWIAIQSKLPIEWNALGGWKWLLSHRTPAHKWYVYVCMHSTHSNTHMYVHMKFAYLIWLSKCCFCRWWNFVSHCGPLDVCLLHQLYFEWLWFIHIEWAWWTHKYKLTQRQSTNRNHCISFQVAQPSRLDSSHFCAKSTKLMHSGAVVFTHFVKRFYQHGYGGGKQSRD